MTYARPLDDVWVHDPFVLVDRAAGRYRLYTSFQAEAYAKAAGVRTLAGLHGTGVLAWSSVDLETWENPVVVFSTPTTRGPTRTRPRGRPRCMSTPAAITSSPRCTTRAVHSPTLSRRAR